MGSRQDDNNNKSIKNIYIQMSFSYLNGVLSQIDIQSDEQFSLFNVRLQKKNKLKQGNRYQNHRLVTKHNLWETKANQFYIQFVKDNFDLFQGKHSVSTRLKAFKNMSEFIKTKTYAQCRIHHFNMIKRYGTTERVIQCLERKIRGVEGTIHKIKDFQGLRVCHEEDVQPSFQENHISWQILDQKYFETEDSDQSYQIQQ